MWTQIESPVGDLRLIASTGALTAIDFVGARAEHPDDSASIAHAAARSLGRPVGDRDDRDPLLVEAAGQLAAYFSRELKEFDLPLAPSGTPVQGRVWDELRTIGYGDTASYGEIAQRLGMTGHAARAVGLANGRNPIPIVIPCHRV
ncbi:MAG: methylated-DNA--[protein]-cysteine S-methyltransferase, partial [Nocardioidaceae bacterium]